jgi:hypothetical protein
MISVPFFLNLIRSEDFGVNGERENIVPLCILSIHTQVSPLACSELFLHESNCRQRAGRYRN